MLESLLNFHDINRRPYLAFAWAFVIVCISIIIALPVGTKMSVGDSVVNLRGMFALAFALIPSSYIMTALIRKEEMMEEKVIRKHYSKGFWERHEKDVLIFLYFFGGAALAFAVATMVLPQDTFQVQISSICGMRPYLSACGGGVSGAVAELSPDFQKIFLNNMQVWFFSFLLAFIFGAGSAFIILWNAGILGIYIGLISRQLAEIPLISIRFLPHGIPEIAGYICAGLAGTLISTAIIRKADREIVGKVLLDSIKVLAVGAIFVLLGAAIEAYL
jgi:uncharacterized membrane protein SpoIIM required for sporulation